MVSIMERDKILSYRTLLFAGFAMLLIANFAYANNELSITNLVVNPQPVVAGQNATIRFQLYDSYGVLNNVNLGLSGNYPLLNYSPTSTQLISSMSQGIYQGSGYYFTYKIKIPPNIQSGTYTIYVTASYVITSSSGTTSTASSSIPISFYISGAPGIALTATPSSAIVPGEQFSATITALNSGTADATNATITVLNSNNFSISGASRFSFGTISAKSSSSATVMLQANSTLPEGKSVIPIMLSYTTQYGKSITLEENVPVSIVVNRPNLVPSIVDAIPQLLYPGSNQTLSILIQNVGTGVAKNVSISFESTPNLTVGGSSSDIFIGAIQSGSSSTQKVFIQASKNDNKTVYHLPVLLTYSDANYQNQITKTEYINVTLQPSARYNITRVSDALYPGGAYMPVTFTIKNTGSERAQQVTLSLQTIYPISPVNPNVYINNLAPGESTNVTFYVDVDAQGHPGQYPVSLYEQWSQPNGASSQQYSNSNNYYAIVYSSGSGGTGLIYDIVGVVIIAAVGYVLYKKFGKKGVKKEKGSK